MQDINTRSTLLHVTQNKRITAAFASSLPAQERLSFRVSPRNLFRQFNRIMQLTVERIHYKRNIHLTQQKGTFHVHSKEWKSQAHDVNATHRERERFPKRLSLTAGAAQHNTSPKPSRPPTRRWNKNTERVHEVFTRLPYFRHALAQYVVVVYKRDYTHRNITFQPCVRIFMLHARSHPYPCVSYLHIGKYDESEPHQKHVQGFVHNFCVQQISTKSFVLCTCTFETPSVHTIVFRPPSLREVPGMSLRVHNYGHNKRQWNNHPLTTLHTMLEYTMQAIVPCRPHQIRTDCHLCRKRKINFIEMGSNHRVKARTRYSSHLSQSARIWSGRFTILGFCADSRWARCRGVVVVAVVG